MFPEVGLNGLANWKNFGLRGMRLEKPVEDYELRIRNEFSSVKPLVIKSDFKLEFLEKL